MLSNAYILAKFRFDTAENEPSKVCRKPASQPEEASRDRRLRPLLVPAIGGGPVPRPRPRALGTRTKRVLVLEGHGNEAEVPGCGFSQKSTM